MNGTRNDDGRSPGADPQVTAALRALYAAPQDDAYWQATEQRMMRRISAAVSGAVHELRPSWWSGFTEFRSTDWRTAGLIAATLTLIAAGASFVRDKEASAQARELAARAAAESAMPLPLDDATMTRARVHLAPDAPERFLNPFDY
jgi:hypothetical protein